jgi:PAS domain S-box-containing protein
MDLSGELARTLLDAAPDPTVIVDGRGRVVFANALVQQVFGHAPARLIGEPVEVLLPERFRHVHPGHRARFFDSPKTRPMGAGLALFGLHKDGHEFPVEISLSPIATDHGLLVTSAIRDVSEQKDIEQRLAEADRAKSRFLAAASHDLRQPLQALNLLNKAAATHARGDETFEDIIDRQQKALDSMSSLLNSLLDISKLDADMIVPTVVDCSVDEMFERLRSNYRDQARTKGLDLVVESTPAAAHTDPELFKQLLGNLLANAVRYTNEGRILLTCKAEPPALRIEVVDTGIGIPENEMTRIFEEFYQIDRSSQRPEGLGLGLSIVKRLADLLGCALEVVSAPGRGTTFSVLVAAASLPVRARAPRPVTKAVVGGSVLIVDDEISVAEATKLLLELEGFEVSIATCERDAVERVSERTPDLIISDYHLRAGETGAAVVSVLRKRLATDVPVIFVTGDTSKLPPAAEFDRAAYLTKPLSGDELLRVINEQLSASTSKTATSP